MAVQAVLPTWERHAGCSKTLSVKLGSTEGAPRMGGSLGPLKLELHH